MPGTFISSSIFLKGPFFRRYSMIRAAVFGPIPGSASKSEADAVLRLMTTDVAGGLGGRGGAGVGGAGGAAGAGGCAGWGGGGGESGATSTRRGRRRKNIKSSFEG